MMACRQPASFGRKADVYGEIAYCEPIFAESDITNADSLRRELV
jgi:hypothetical protein